jgi:hypothetical protein
MLEMTYAETVVSRRVGPRRACARRAALVSGRQPALLGRAPCPRQCVPRPPRPEVVRPKAARPEGSRAPRPSGVVPAADYPAMPYRGRRTRETSGPSAAVRCATPAYKGPVYSFVRVYLPLSFPCHALASPGERLPAPASACRVAALPAAATGRRCAARRPPPRANQPPKSSPRLLKTLPPSSPGRERIKFDYEDDFR